MVNRKALIDIDRPGSARTLASVIYLAASFFTTPLYNNYLNRPLLFDVILITVAALLLMRLTA